MALVLVALALLTISFRSPTSGALHDVEGAGSTVLRPFQIAASRVAQPFRDAYDYFDGLANAKSENAKLKKEIAAARSQELALHRGGEAGEAAREAPPLPRRADFPHGYRAVTARVISAPRARSRARS